MTSSLCYQPQYKNWAPESVSSPPISSSFTLTQEIVPACDRMTELRVWVNSEGHGSGGHDHAAAARPHPGEGHPAADAPQLRRARIRLADDAASLLKQTSIRPALHSDDHRLSRRRHTRGLLGETRVPQRPADGERGTRWDRIFCFSMAASPACKSLASCDALKIPRRTSRTTNGSRTARRSPPVAFPASSTSTSPAPTIDMAP